MHTNEKIAVGIYIILSLVALVILVVLVTRKKKCAENFKKCFCSQNAGGRGKICQDTNDTWASYERGVTENTPNWNERSWTTIFPGDVDFPQSEGCGLTTEGYTYLKNQPYKGQITL
jgi:hypothetical protein